jgi:hypothetical protein
VSWRGIGDGLGELGDCLFEELETSFEGGRNGGNVMVIVGVGR